MGLNNMTVLIQKVLQISRWNSVLFWYESLVSIVHLIQLDSHDTSMQSEYYWSINLWWWFLDLGAFISTLLFLWH